MRTIISVLLSAEIKLCQRRRWRSLAERSRIYAALRQSKEEVKICVYPCGEYDDIDDLLRETRQSCDRMKS